MIIDSPFIAGLALGADRVLPQAGDSQLTINPEAQAIVPLCQPHDVNSATNALMNGSFIASVTQNFTNTGFSGNPLVTCAKGLWRLTINAGVWFDFAHVAASTPDFRVGMLYEGFLISLMTVFAKVGDSTITSDFIFLARSTFIIESLIGATTVAQHTDTQISIQGQKLI